MKYPWLEKQWQQLWQAKQSNRLPHALLFTGDEGVGKLELAKQFAQSLLCKHVKDNGETCGFCHDCTLTVGSTHPNIYYVTPEKAGQAIKVDQIRAVSDFIQQSSLQGKYRIAIVYPAHNMNVNAANALLKTLEEPPEGAIIVLVTEQHGHLPVTVVSRCQRIGFPLPDHELALRWLKDQLDDGATPAEQLLTLANGAPLSALTLQDKDMLSLRQEVYQGLHQVIKHEVGPLELAAKWQSVDLVEWVALVSSWLVDIVRLQAGAKVMQIRNQDFETTLQQIANITPMPSNIKIIDGLQHMRSQLQSGIHLNKQLAIESLLINWAESAQ